MAQLDWIPDDGYTEEGFIAALPNVHGEFRFTYRPFLVEEQDRLLSASDKITRDEYDGACAEAVASHMRAWSLLDAKGNPVPIQPVNVLRLKPQLFSRLYLVVAGLQASDTDPKWSDGKRIEVAQRKHESALSGKPTSAIQQEADRKN